MRATARSYLISPEAMGSVAPGPRRLRDRLTWAYLTKTDEEAAAPPIPTKELKP
jgi:hypothetical protein